MSIDKNTGSLNKYSKTQRDGALKKYKLIEPFLNQEDSLSAICHRHKVSIRTARRWVAAYKKQRLEGLIRQKRKDIGKKRSVSDEMQLIIEGMYLQNAHLSIKSIYRKIRENASKNNQLYPSYRTLCNLINELPKSMVTLAHHGSKAYKQKYDLLCRHQAAYPNQLWQADHALLDIFVIENNKQKSSRPWLTIIIDDYSRAIAGYELSFARLQLLKLHFVCAMLFGANKKHYDLYAAFRTYYIQITVLLLHPIILNRFVLI